MLARRLRYGDAFEMDGFGLAAGKGVRLVIERPGTLRIGERVQLGDGCEIAALGGEVAIGPNVFFNRNCTVVARGRITIGSDCIFGPNVAVYDHDHGFDDRERPIWAQEPTVAPVSIGSDVWIAANAVITAGVEIGDRVVVGANAVVTKSLASGAVYAGNPAVLVRRI